VKRGFDTVARGDCSQGFLCGEHQGGVDSASRSRQHFAFHRPSKSFKDRVKEKVRGGPWVYSGLRTVGKDSNQN